MEEILELKFKILPCSFFQTNSSRNISGNTKWGIRKRFRDGVAVCNTKRFLGYDKNENGNLVINEE